jgi:hypothetical protein
MSSRPILPTTRGRSKVELVKDIQMRVASALGISPELVNIEGFCTRYLSLFLQCWGVAAGTRIFAKVFLVDLYPIPPRFATPWEELATPENPVRTVADQINIEWTKFQQMRVLMGPQNVPALLARSVHDRILVYEKVNGLRVDSLAANDLANWCFPRRGTIRSVETAMIQAGAWLRVLHDSTSQGFESIEFGEVVEGLRALIQKKQLENSSDAVLALKVFEVTRTELNDVAPVHVPVAMNHGDFTSPNILWDHDHQQLWVVDFELSARRPVLHDLATMIFSLRKDLLRPLTSPRVVSRCEDCFWKGYGEIPKNLYALSNALATARLFYYTLPKLRTWREQRGWWAGMKASLYTRFFEPTLVQRVLRILPQPIGSL